MERHELFTHLGPVLDEVFLDERGIRLRSSGVIPRPNRSNFCQTRPRSGLGKKDRTDDEADGHQRTDGHPGDV